ncbi:Putative phage abortive infection protein [Rhizobium tibeticum]|uniref:Phage abortive infection protein n=1 Tax=Rhizobium tibeticum TaxID=501024 RepID=A0A1H8JZ33_9HYPH|nr:putative phage abortive infection protein [Rhizobium tibeticum]SEH78506.1 hypothetical protein RTCCBAU85039_2340 [Rhizobium tibeticum]SEN86009.1 Putative phage abortive infection protein [Rhizobium tibeticum]
MSIPVRLILIVSGAWFFWVMLPRFLVRVGMPVKMEALGQWGDSFGALNAAFSAAAVIGVLVTLRMQSKEISDQQRQIESQNERLERSEFDASFFQLFELSRQLREGATFEIPENSKRGGTGRAAFEAAHKHMQFLLGPSYTFPDMITDVETTIRDLYRDDVHRYAEYSFGPYFRILYTILRRISESRVLDGQTKIQYGNLVRSQLSTPEVALIAANALTEASNDFRKFVVEFRLLKYLPHDEYRGFLETVYPGEAFAARD